MDYTITRDACIDTIDHRSYTFEEVFGEEGIDMPKRVFYNDTPVYRQADRNTPSTAYACTCYSATHAVNEGNAIEAKEFDTVPALVDPVGVWVEALKKGAKPKAGWSLLGSSNLVKNMGYISGYAFTRKLAEVKKALAQGHLVQTGSNLIDWQKTYANGSIVVPGTCYGHAFIINGYDDEKGYLICRNSYGKQSGVDGHFFIRYEDFSVLFTCYIYTDKEDIKPLQARKRRQEAVDKGYWNGSNPEAFATRYEASVFAMKTGKRKTDRYIWNRQARDQAVTLYEAVTMLTNATRKTFSFDPYAGKDKNSTITRGELAELCVRL